MLLLLWPLLLLAQWQLFALAARVPREICHETDGRTYERSGYLRRNAKILCEICARARERVFSLSLIVAGAPVEGAQKRTFRGQVVCLTP